MLRKITIFAFSLSAILASGLLCYCYAPSRGHIPELPANDWGAGLIGAVLVAALVNGFLFWLLRDGALQKPSFIGSGVVLVGFLIVFLFAVPQQRKNRQQFRYKVNHLNPNLPSFEGTRPPDYYKDFNLIEQKLSEIPGLQIVDSWKQEEVVLRDCEFEIAINNASALLTFFEHQDWVGMFEQLDGIRFENSIQTRFISSDQLRDAGIDVTGLTDLITQLPEVQAFCWNADLSGLDDREDYNAAPKQYSRYIMLKIPKPK